MRRSWSFLMVSVFLFAFQAGNVATWPAEINKTITRLQPAYQSTSTNFSQIPLAKSQIGGAPQAGCPELLPLAKEVYQKEIYLPDLEDGKKFKIYLEVVLCENKAQAIALRKEIGELRFNHGGTDTCPQSVIEKKPLYTFAYGNTVIILDTWLFRNVGTFKKYATAFEKNLLQQQELKE